MKITLLLSSVRDGRLADIVLQKVIKLIGDKFQVTIVDPKEYQLPLLNLRYYEMKEPTDVFRKLHNIFDETDGFIIVTAEYNHGIPPALKNMLDHFGKEFKRKGCGIVSYSDGAVGGARSGERCLVGRSRRRRSRWVRPCHRLLPARPSVGTSGGPRQPGLPRRKRRIAGPGAGPPSPDGARTPV